MRLLSVDDSKTIRDIIHTVAEVLGFDFLEAENGQDGIRVLEQENGAVDLILLDWNMPVMDGMTMLRTIKADERFKQIPVTMVTTEIERHKVIEAIRVGARNYVMKPFSQESLVSKILESLNMGI